MPGVLPQCWNRRFCLSGDRAGSRDTVSLLEQIDLWLVGNEENGKENQRQAMIEDHKRAVSSCLAE